MIVYWSFTGFEIATLFSEETKGGQPVIYKSLKIVIGITIFVYLFLNISLIGSVGSYTLANSSAPIATASELILRGSNIVIGLIAIIAIIAMLSAINAYIVGTTRVLQNISYHLKLQILKDLINRGSPLAATITVAITVAITASVLLNLFLKNSTITTLSSQNL